MSELELSVLLLSSNARRRYAEDILTALALPEGAVIQFRYETDYVAPALQQIVANGKVLGQTAMLGFVADAESATPFLLPIRIATITHAENVADMFVLRLRVGGYPDPSDNPMNLTEICTESAKLYAKLVQSNGGHYYPATVKFPNLHISSAGDPAQKWIGIARRLTLHPTFAASYFLRIDPPVSTSRCRDRRRRLPSRSTGDPWAERFASAEGAGSGPRRSLAGLREHRYCARWRRVAKLIALRPFQSASRIDAACWRISGRALRILARALGISPRLSLALFSQKLCRRAMWALPDDTPR